MFERLLRLLAPGAKKLGYATGTNVTKDIKTVSNFTESFQKICSLHIIYITASLRMNPRGSKPVANIRN
jgi:hypothetical protein